MKDIKKGDHIYYKTKRLARFTHHGIYCGNGRVIHLNGWGGKVSEVSLQDFLGDEVSSDEILIFTLFKSDPPDKVIERARAYSENSGEPVRGSFGAYSMHSNNCEHFATFCQTGVRQSRQVGEVADNTEGVQLAMESIRVGAVDTIKTQHLYPTLFNMARIAVKSTPPQLQPVALMAAGVLGGAGLVVFGVEKGVGAVGSLLKRASGAK